MNKYHSKKVTVDGITFDSKKEANRWTELSLLQRAGTISGLRRQVRFRLLPGVYENYPRFSRVTGKRLTDGTRCVEMAVYYIADFVYIRDGKTIVEDVKGHRTREFIIKKKMMRFFHGIEVQEI